MSHTQQIFAEQAQIIAVLVTQNHHQWARVSTPVADTSLSARLGLSRQNTREALNARLEAADSAGYEL